MTLTAAITERDDDAIEARAAEIYEDIFLYESVETASWAAALELGLTARVDACRAQAMKEIMGL